MEKALEIFPQRTTIEFWEKGIVLKIVEKNTTIIKQFPTPCFITHKQHIFELHQDYIIHHKNENYECYKGEQFKAALPALLEFGELIIEYKNPPTKLK